MTSTQKASRSESPRRMHRMSRLSLVVALAVSSVFLTKPGTALADNVFVTIDGDDSISVVDSTTNTVVSSIWLPYSPVFIAISQDGKRGYVTTSANTLAVLDTETHVVTANIPVGPVPGGVALNPSGTRAYVAVEFGSYVAVVDTASLTVINQIPVPVHLATTVAVSPDGNRLYVGNQASLVYVIDLNTANVITTIPVGNFVGEVAVHPAGTFVYAAVINSNIVSVIDASTNAVVMQIPVGPGCTYCGPSTVAVDPLGDYVYAPAQGNFLLHSIDTSNHTVVATTPTGNYPFSSAVHPDGKTLYITNYIDGTLSVIAPQTNSTVATIPVGSHPRGIGVVRTPVAASTPAGTNVSVTTDASLSDGSTATSVDMKFSQVLSPGETTITATAPLKGPPLPSDFKLGTGNSAYYYDVSTTAVISGSVEICFEWQEGQFAREQSIKVMHYEDGAWKNVTTQVDPLNNIACGTVTSLSPFALAQQAYRFTGFYPPVDNPPIVNSVKAGQGVPVKFELGGNQGLDIFVGGAPSSQQIHCSTGAPLDVISETVSTGSSGLHYDATSGEYVYVWKSDKTWANTCRQLTLNFNDDSTRKVNFLFTK